MSNDRQTGSPGEPLAVYCAVHRIKKACAMAMNRIQFQTGLSMPEFFKRYGSESECAVALETAPWPGGFRCPRCDNAAHGVLRGSTQKPEPGSRRCDGQETGQAGGGVG